jgi:hypothetical protein
MSTNAENIETIKTNTLARIAEMSANPQPNYSVDGQTVSWGDLMAQLQKTVEWCNQQASAETPFEVMSQGYT